ncbi:uncharacterized protein LY89DRAFT_685432 [Mollisia scopiformis]|uniref:Uncharacterized protein n=1 Tax=Mollisia scopiformis TaxID=149040 RepID=A0A194X8N3_MOLSC|nr:uncharacterized protein LY89DRAFT_685432 [Mollisia scopiformis]KUJ16474.1 hypothetical protein LY89DRAFT_685432 [Mollisia scopiformis]
MCCHKNRRAGGCHSRRYNNINPPLAPGQEPVVVYDRRPGLMGMFAQHMAQKREAKQQQQMAYQPRSMSIADGKLEDQKLHEERMAQAYWDERNKAATGRGVDHVDVKQAAENNRFSKISVGTELPSYGQAMKQ